MKDSNHTQRSVDRVELKGELAEFREALEDEISEIQKNGQGSIILSSGQLVKNAGDGKCVVKSTVFS